MKISGVYQITNLINNKSYIGSSINIYKRWGKHKTELNTKTHHTKHLQRAWHKYGASNFKFEILKKCDIQNCIPFEQFFIDLLNPNYNICKKAGSCLGVKRTVQQNKRRSESMIGKKASEIAKNNMRLAQLGKHHSIDHINKRIKNNPNIKPIFQYDLNNNMLKEWKNATEPAKYYNITSISRAINGYKPTACGFIWMDKYNEIEYNNRINRVNVSNPNYKVLQLSKNGEILKIFNNPNDVMSTMNFNKNNMKNVFACLNNKRSSAYGYKWKKQFNNIDNE